MLAYPTRSTLGGVLLFLGACCVALAAIIWQGPGMWGLTARWATVVTLAVACIIGYVGLRLRSPRASTGYRTGHIVLYEAPMEYGAGRRVPPVTIRGARDAIERFIPEDDFGRLFDRRAVWRTSAFPVVELPGEAIGVWGRRKCQRLRRILRERGA